MTELVLDASVAIKWFAVTEPRVWEALQLLERYRAGDLGIIVPPLLYLEVINIAGRKWGRAEDALVRFAASLLEFGFDVSAPDLEDVARWTAAGLTAYDASYVALAESRGVQLITDDETVLAVAGDVAVALSSIDT